MSTKLFVGNLPFSLSEANLEEMFSQLGRVVSVSIPLDRDTGRKRGFAFVEMESQADAEAAMKHFNGQNIEGRQIVVNAAKEKEARSGGGAGGGRGGSGGGGGGGGKRW